MPPAKKPAAKRRYRRKANEDIGAIRVPDRFTEVVGDLEGVPLLKALYYLNEGERIGREGGQIGGQLDAIKAGVVALLESARNQGVPTPQQNPGTIPFPERAPRKAPDDDSAYPPGVTPEDAQNVRQYAMACAGGHEQIANAAYAKVIEDAQGAGGLNSRWQTMVEDIVETMRERMGVPAPVPPSDDPLLMDGEEEPEYDEGA